jgi:hypothetical protein
MNFPASDLATVDILKHIQVVIEPANFRPAINDVPTPNLIVAFCHITDRRCGLVNDSAAAAMMCLIMCPQYAIEVQLAAVTQSLVSELR